MIHDGFLRRLQAKHNLTPSRCDSGENYYEMELDSPFEDGFRPNTEAKDKGGLIQASLPPANSSSSPSSRGPVVLTNFGNDYTDNFIHTGSLPQSHITNRRAPQEGYPKLQQLHALKALQVQTYANRPYSIRCLPGPTMNERLMGLTQRNGVQFDVVLVSADHSIDRKLLLNLPIGKITPRPSLCFIWVPGSDGWLESARLMLEKWGFRRSEDIVYIPTDESDVYFPQVENYNIYNYGNKNREIFQQSTWHCLMGLKGTLRRNQDSDLIHCNVDTDVILGQDSKGSQNSTHSHYINVIPENIYTIIENFSLMSRRIHIVPGYSHNLRSSSSSSRPSIMIRKPLPRRGWVIMGPETLEDNFDAAAYTNELKANGNKVPVNAKIENLRPKTPPGMGSSGGGGNRGKR